MMYIGPARQLPLPFAPQPRPPVQPFFAAPSNEEALAWLERPESWPDGRLLLWGPRGTGKSHLLRLWSERHAAHPLAGAGLRWPVSVSGPVAVDDADTAPEPALLHLLNDARESGRRVLLAAPAPAAAWPTRLPDLASRLRATTAVALAPAEDTLLRAVLRRSCADRQLPTPEPVQDWLLLHLPRTPAAMEEAAARLDHAVLAAGGRVTRALAAQIVDDMTAMWHAESP